MAEEYWLAAELKAEKNLLFLTKEGIKHNKSNSFYINNRLVVADS